MPGEHLLGQHRLRVARQVVHAVALVEAHLLGLRADELARGHATVAEGVGLVEEGDHTAVAQGQFAESAEQQHHLQDADTEEHVHECTGLDEHERLAGFAGHGFSHECLAGAWRAVQQDAAGHMPTLRLDDLGVVEEHHVLLHPRQHLVLPVHIGEAGLDVLRHERLDATARQQVEDADELEHADGQAEEQLEEERQAAATERFVQQSVGRFGDGTQERQTPDLREDEEEDDEVGRDAHHAAEPEAHPRVAAAPEAVPSTPHPVHPEAVVPGRPFADEVVDLAQHFEAGEYRNPPHGAQAIDEDVVPRHVGDVAVLQRRGIPEDHAEHDEHLDAVEEHQLAACLRNAVVGYRFVNGDHVVGCERRGHASILQELRMSKMSRSYCL